MALTSLRPSVLMLPRVSAPAVAPAVAVPAPRPSGRVAVVAKVGKTALTDMVASATGLSRRDTAATIDALMDVMQEQILMGERVTIIGFGTFDIRHRAQRQGRNPSTGQAMTIEASKTVGFKVAPGFKELVNSGPQPVVKAAPAPKPAASTQPIAKAAPVPKPKTAAAVAPKPAPAPAAAKKTVPRAAK